MIELHPEEKMPLYEQLYNALAQDIRSGALQPGKALPGRRTMAAQLGISTNTVDTAYQMLAAEGLAVTYLEYGSADHMTCSNASCFRRSTTCRSSSGSRAITSCSSSSMPT